MFDGKCFFDLPVKNEEKSYEKIIKMSKNNDYTNGTLLDFDYFKENYKLIETDLSKQTKLKDLNKLILLENLRDKTMEQQWFSSFENQKKLFLSFYKILSISYKNRNKKDCKFVKQFWELIYKICNKENGTLLKMKQKVLIRITIRQSF